MAFRRIFDTKIEAYETLICTLYVGGDLRSYLCLNNLLFSLSV